MSTRWWLWAPVVVWMAIIFAGSSVPNPPPPPAGLTDKREHLIEYGILAALSVRAFARGRWIGVTVVTVASAVVFAGAYGGADEWHQRFIPGRTPEAADVIADVAGATLVALALWGWKTVKNAK